MPSKKGQKLTVSLVSKIKDYFGIWEVTVLINNKAYTYPISSEFLLGKVEKQLRLNKPGRALHLLKQAKITGFNSFEEEVKDGRVKPRGEGLIKITGTDTSQRIYIQPDLFPRDKGC
jgi:hypothetical protein